MDVTSVLLIAYPVTSAPTVLTNMRGIIKTNPNWTQTALQFSESY